MSKKYVQPSISLQSFNCPSCGATAHQTWYDVRLLRRESGEPPHLITKEIAASFEKESAQQDKEADSAKLVEWFHELASQEALILDWPGSGQYTNIELGNIHVSECYSCGDPTIWLYDKILHPSHQYVVEPNPDLPQSALDAFKEASAVLEVSPRSSCAMLRLALMHLCEHLGVGSDLNNGIAKLVSQGLPEAVKKSMDVVRVTGNNAVHPGKMDLKDNREAAIQLLKLVNIVTHQMITVPKQIEDLHSALPQATLDAIAKRDARAKNP